MPLARGPLVETERGVGAAPFASWSMSAKESVSMRRGVRGVGTVDDMERMFSLRRDASGLGS